MSMSMLAIIISIINLIIISDGDVSVDKIQSGISAKTTKQYIIV